MDIFAPEAGVYEKEWELPAHKHRGWVHEVEVQLREGEAIAYECHQGEPGSPGRVKFNVHSHEGRDVTYHVQVDALDIEGTFVAPWQGKFYLMWENVSEDPVRLRVLARRRGGA